MALPRFRIPAGTHPVQGVIRLQDPRELHHALRVLRLAVGDACMLFDGAGAAYRGQVRAADGGGLVIAVEPVVADDFGVPPLHITLVQALPKLPALETVLQQATELGVARIIPVMTARSVMRVTPAQWTTKQPRWERILTAAAKQSQRADAPMLEAPMRWADWVRQRAAVPGNADTLLMPTLAQPRLPLLAHVLRRQPLTVQVTLCIGPEGDFTPDEAQEVQRLGGTLVSLGAQSLRVYTAVVACMAVLQQAWQQQHDPTTAP